MPYAPKVEATGNNNNNNNINLVLMGENHQEVCRLHLNQTLLPWTET
jgi:hypothetical protein